MDTHIGERDTDEKQRREKKTRSQRWEDHCTIKFGVGYIRVDL